MPPKTKKSKKTKTPKWVPDIRGKEVRSWELRLPWLRCITVHRYVGCEGEWFVSCPALDIDAHKIADDKDGLWDAETLQVKAIDVVQEALDNLQESLAKYRKKAGQ